MRCAFPETVLSCFQVVSVCIYKAFHKDPYSTKPVKVASQAFHTPSPLSWAWLLFPLFPRK